MLSLSVREFLSLFLPLPLFPPSPLSLRLSVSLLIPLRLPLFIQFSMAILACQKESQFAAAYQKGVKKVKILKNQLYGDLFYTGKIPWR